MWSLDTIEWAKNQRKWFYFSKSDSWLSPSQVSRLNHLGIKIDSFVLRYPREMLINYNILNENTKEYSSGQA